MGKDKKGKKSPAVEGVVQNATPKFAVLDCPGVKQPELGSSSGGGAAASGKASKDGLQGRRAKAGSGPLIEKTGLSIGPNGLVVGYGIISPR